MVSNLPAQSLTRGIYPLCGALLGVLIAFSPNAAIAQSASSGGNVNPLQDFKTRDNYDPFSSNSGGSVAPGFFELIHRATQGFQPGTSASEQGQSLDSAAVEFRNQQRKRLDPGSDPAVTPQATTPAPAKPEPKTAQ